MEKELSIKMILSVKQIYWLRHMCWLCRNEHSNGAYAPDWLEDILAGKNMTEVLGLGK